MFLTVSDSTRPPRVIDYPGTACLFARVHGGLYGARPEKHGTTYTVRGFMGGIAFSVRPASPEEIAAFRAAGAVE